MDFYFCMNIVTGSEKGFSNRKGCGQTMEQVRRSSLSSATTIATTTTFQTLPQALEESGFSY